MKVRLKNRSNKWMFRFSLRTLLILSGYALVANAGFLLAQQLLKNPNELLRDAIGGRQFLFNVDLFMYIRESPIIPIFGISILVFIALFLGHRFTFGPKDMGIENEADAIPWWTLFERVLHGIVVISFLFLIISGLMVTFGRILGGGTSTLVMGTLHEYAGFVYGPAFVVIVLLWAREAMPRSYDMEWFKHMGGYLGYKGELKSGKFNAGQKLYFWVMAITGIIHIYSGFMLTLNIGGMAEMRFNVVLHFFSAIPMVLMFLLHVYMTTLGTRGALMGMINGKFSKKAALKFHSEASALANLETAKSDK